MATAGTLRDPLRDGALALGFSLAAAGVTTMGFSGDGVECAGAGAGFDAVDTSTFRGSGSALGVSGSVLPRVRAAPLAPRPARLLLWPPRPPRFEVPPLALEDSREAELASGFLRLLRSLGRDDGSEGVAEEGLGAGRVAGVAIIGLYQP